MFSERQPARRDQPHSPGAQHRDYGAAWHDRPRDRPALAGLTTRERLVALGADLCKGTRVHVVFRESAYAYSDLQYLEQRGRLVIDGVKRHRVQYLLFQIER